MSGLSERGLRQVLAWLVLALLVVPIGGALWLGFVHGESPCILCWSERTSMLLIALVALFVVRFGPRPRYVGMLVVLGAWGTFMGLRHSALHLARDVGQGFAGSILGAHTYVWAWVIHWLVLLAGGVLLIFYRGPLSGDPDVQPGRLGRFAMGLLVVIAGANAVQAFASTGPPPHIGQGDPIRLSWNPRNWVWQSEEAEGAVSLRGGWTIPRPDPAAPQVDPSPAHGPLAGLSALPLLRWERIAAPLNGTLTDLALGPRGQALAVTDHFGVYVLDSTFTHVLHRAVLDPGFSVDLTPLSGAAFLGADTIAVMSTNKSYVLLRPVAHADPTLEWRHFLESDGTLAEVARSRFATVRARQMYALALAYDSASGELVTVGVPSPRHEQLVVSRFARGDLLLSSEFLPALGPGLTLSGKGRGLDEYVVTGAAVADGKLYAVNVAFSTLLVIDLATRTVTDAYALPGISRPVGVAVRGPELLVAQADGRVAVLRRPGA